MFRVKLSPEALTRLRRALEGVEGLEFAALLGSLAVRGESSHDVDVAVRASPGDRLRVLSRVAEAASKALGIPEDYVDVVDLDRADLGVRS